MVRHWDYSVNLSKKVEEELKKAQFLAEGHEGIIFKLPHNRILKIFREESRWKDEVTILQKTKKSKNFPIVYESDKNYIIREYVDGIQLDKFIKRKGFNEKLAKNLFNLVKEFKRLNFTRVDIRCKDIYVCEKGNLVVIDPKNNFTKRVKYPRHLMKGLNKLYVLEKFLEEVKKQDEEIYSKWKASFEVYWEKFINK